MSNLEKHSLNDSLASSNKLNGDKTPRFQSLSTHYPFVDLVRFISMIGIVWAHVVLWSPYKGGSTEYLDDSYMQYFIAYKQIFKFSVICFFMISGFLLGDKITTVEAIPYFKRRFKSTMKPYIIAYSMFLGLLFFKAFVLKSHVTDSNTAYSIIKFSIVDTLFWFMPNYLASLAIILLCRKFLNSVYFGLCLFIITLGYSCITVYSSAYASPHTTAILGFVSFLWLGAYIKQKNIAEKIRKISTPLLIMVAATLYIASCVESYWLFHQKLEYFNVLRIFNQLYAVSMFALLVKLGYSEIKFGPFVPRKETYGIYLYHGLFTYFFLPKIIVLINDYFGLQFVSYEILTRLTIITTYFIICYISTVITVKLLLRFKLAYL